jgi:hypothetical protein
VAVFLLVVGIGISGCLARGKRGLEAHVPTVRVPDERLDDAPVLRREWLGEVGGSIRCEGGGVGHPQDRMRLEFAFVVFVDEDVGTAGRVSPLA